MFESNQIKAYDRVNISTNSSESKIFIEVLKSIPNIEVNPDYEKQYGKPEHQKPPVKRKPMRERQQIWYKEEEDPVENEPQRIPYDMITIFTKVKKQDPLFIRYEFSIYKDEDISNEVRLTLSEKFPLFGEKHYQAFINEQVDEEVSSSKIHYWDTRDKETILQCFTQIITSISNIQQSNKQLHDWENKIFPPPKKKEQQPASSLSKRQQKIIQPIDDSLSKNFFHLAKKEKMKNQAKARESFQFQSEWTVKTLKLFAQIFITNLPFLHNMSKILTKEETLNLKDLAVMTGGDSDLNKVVKVVNDRLAVIIQKRSKDKELDALYYSQRKAKKDFTFSSKFKDSLLDEIVKDYVTRLPFRYPMRFILEQKLKGKLFLDLCHLKISTGYCEHSEMQTLVDRVSSKLDKVAKIYRDQKNLEKRFARRRKNNKASSTGDLIPLLHIKVGPQILNRGSNLYFIRLTFTPELSNEAERISTSLDYKKIVYNDLNIFTCRVIMDEVQTQEDLFKSEMNWDYVDLYLYVLDLFHDETILLDHLKGSHAGGLFNDFASLNRKIANMAIIQPQKTNNQRLDPNLEIAFEKSNIGLCFEDDDAKSFQHTVTRMLRKSCSLKKAWQPIYYDAFNDMKEFQNNECNSMDIYEIFKEHAQFDDELYDEFIKDIGVLRTSQEFITLHFNVSRTIENRMQTKLEQFEKLLIKDFEESGGGREQEKKELEAEIKRLKLISFKLLKWIDKETLEEEEKIPQLEKNITNDKIMLKRFKILQVKGSDTLALQNELKELKNKLIELLSLEENLRNLQNIFEEKYLFKIKIELSEDHTLSLSQFLKPQKAFHKLILKKMDDGDAFSLRNITQFIKLLANDTNENEKEEESPKVGFEKILVSGYNNIKETLQEPLSGSYDANAIMKVSQDEFQLPDNFFEDHDPIDVKEEEFNAELLEEFQKIPHLNIAENPFRIQDVIEMTENTLMPLLDKKMQELKQELITSIDQWKKSQNAVDLKKQILCKFMSVNMLQTKSSKLQKELNSLKHSFKIYKSNYAQADDYILQAFQTLSVEYKNSKIHIQNQMDIIERKLLGFQYADDDKDAIAQFFGNFTSSDLALIRDYFFQMQKTLKFYAQQCVNFELFQGGVGKAPASGPGNALAKIFHLFESKPTNDLKFSDIIPNPTKFTQSVEEIALQITMNKTDFLLNLLPSDSTIIFQLINMDERQRHRLDKVSKVLAYLDASCIIANAYTNFLSVRLELQDNPNDIYNTLPIISMFTESAKQIVFPKSYDELLDLLDQKYHNKSLCGKCVTKRNNNHPFSQDDHIHITHGNCSRCQDKGVIKDIWNIKKTQTFTLQKLESMWIDNINPTAITKEIILSPDGRSLKLSKTEYEKNIKIKAPESLSKHRQLLRQNYFTPKKVVKLEKTPPSIITKSALVVGKKYYDQEEEEEAKEEVKEKDEKEEEEAEEEQEQEQEQKEKKQIFKQHSPFALTQLPNSPTISDSTGLGLTSPVKIVCYGQTKVYDLKKENLINVFNNIEGDDKNEQQQQPISQRLSVVQLKKQNLRKIYGGTRGLKNHSSEKHLK